MKRLAALCLAPAVTLAACEQPQSRSSMDLLRAGDPGVCTAADVEETVRKLIYPDGIAREGYSIAFADASLEAFDKVVSRATCNAALTIDGPAGTVVERTMIDFVVSPAAQDTSQFVVSGRLSAFTDRLESAVADAATARAEEEGERQAQEALAATVKPGWLIGRWVPATAGSEACATGPFLDFGQKSQLTTRNTAGRWSLHGLTIKFVTAHSSGSIKIAQAAGDEFVTDDADERGGTYRRCSGDEMATTIPDADDLANRLELEDFGKIPEDPVT